MTKLLWTQRQSIGPAPRFGHAIAYDRTRKQVVLFGGNAGNGRLFGDTWVWDGDNWTQVSDIGPSARTAHALAYDEQRARIVLFGGQLADHQAGDTWEWDGQDWTQIANAGPGSRASHALAYHAGRQRVTLFGGLDAAQTVTADTWEWDGNEWTQQEDMGPAARHRHVMAGDSIRERIVLFGGSVAPAGDALHDTWEWDGTEWRQVADFGPDAAMGAAMVFKKNRVELFGGMGSPNGQQPQRLFHFTWEWASKRWTLRQDIGPGPRVEHAMAFDTDRARVVFFGGLTVPPGPQLPPESILGDTWEHRDDSPDVGPTLPPFDFAVQPASVISQGNASAVFTLTPLLVPLQVQLFYTAQVLMDLPVFLFNVTIPANVAHFEAGLSVQQIFAQLTPNGFVAPGDVTIMAKLDDHTKTATLRILP